jgi:predicted ATPase
MNVIKNNFFVLTGGPGGGKSTLLKALEAKGFPFVVETARLIIQERLRQGLSPRPAPSEFAVQMFEQDHKNFMEHLADIESIFFDRSFLDSAALLFEADKKFFQDIKNILDTHRFNSKVFITPPWQEIYMTDDERDQTFEEALVVYENLYDWYAVNGYTLIPVPKTSVEGRVDFVLHNMH